MKEKKMKKEIELKELEILEYLMQQISKNIEYCEDFLIDEDGNERHYNKVEYEANKNILGVLNIIVVNM